MRRAVLVAALLLAACAAGDDERPEPTGNERVITIPEGHDVGFACNGTTGVYTTGRGGVAAVANDPECLACPTEDSCTVDYRDGAWHIEEVTP